jgi:two-component system LytT family response regulator
MNWFLILSDAKCKKELRRFLQQNATSLLFKTEADKAFRNIERTLQTSAVNTRTRNDSIVVNSSNNMHVIKINNIMHCQSNQSYTQFHLTGGKKITATRSLKQIEAVLKKHHFTRIHQSHLVNINYIEKYVKGIGGYLVLNDGTELPVAVRKKEYLMRELEKL